MTTTTTATKSAKFDWSNEGVQEKLHEMYLTATIPVGDETEDDAILRANHVDSLTEIAEILGAKSAVAVRGKLSSDKIFKKAGTPPAARGGASRVRKAHFIKALEELAGSFKSNGEAVELASLENARLEDLKELCQLIDAIQGENTLEEMIKKDAKVDSLY